MDHIVARCVDGDSEAFGELYELFVDKVFGYFYYQTSNRHEAEDLSEQTFLNAWHFISKSEGLRINNFRSWLFSIAHNLLIDHRKKQRPEAPIESVETSPPTQDSLEERIDLAETGMELKRAIEKLSEKEREVIVYRMISGLSHSETAKAMGISEGYVRVLQHRGLAGMRAIMKDGRA